MKKLSNVVLLPVNESLLVLKGNKLFYRNELNKGTFIKTSLYTPQHLYFTTDEEIKEGDWCVYKNKYIVQTKETDPSGYICSDRCKPLFHEVKKIVASTDKSLGLPRPSNEFLKAYCDSYNSGKPITEVNIEYDSLPIWHTRCPNRTMITEIVGHTDVIKVAPDNTISISKVEDKTYTLEELTKLVKSAWYTGRDRGKYKEDLQPSYENKIIDSWLKDRLK